MPEENKNTPSQPNTINADDREYAMGVAWEQVQEKMGSSPAKEENKKSEIQNPAASPASPEARKLDPKILDRNI